MILSIKNIPFVVIARIIRNIIWTLVWLAVAFVLVIILIPKENPDDYAIMGFGFIIIVPLIHMVITGIDAYIYAKSASITIKENTVDLHANNLFNRSNNSLPISQINQVNVVQTFIFKLFGVSVVVFSDEAGNTNTLWGFNYNEAVQFANEFSSKYKIKITN